MCHGLDRVRTAFIIFAILIGIGSIFHICYFVAGIISFPAATYILMIVLGAVGALFMLIGCVAVAKDIKCLMWMSLIIAIILIIGHLVVFSFCMLYLLEYLLLVIVCGILLLFLIIAAILLTIILIEVRIARRNLHFDTIKNQNNRSKY